VKKIIFVVEALRFETLFIGDLSVLRDINTMEKNNYGKSRTK